MTSAEIRNLLSHISADKAASADAAYSALSRLLAAPAPANSCCLPGAVGEVIIALAEELGLSGTPIGSSGNLAVDIGEPAAPLDLLITAHMDRPCFRLRDLADGTLYPLCAIRVPGDGYSCAAIALRYQADRVTRVATGQMRFDWQQGEYRIRFTAESGELRAGDTVMMHTAPQLRGFQVIGAGLDNAIGVLLALLGARMLKQYSDVAERGGRIRFAFTDQEEGPPSGLFGQGASRLAHELAPPRLGFINIDGHNLDEAAGHRLGVGASHAFVSGDGRGSVVPLDYQARAEALAGPVNQARPGTVRLNYSYVSRSDDMLLSAWARCLGLCGVIVAKAHTTEETAALADIVSAAHWLPAFVASIMPG